MPLTILLSGDYIEEVLNKLEKTQLKKGVERIGNLISNENLTNVKFKVIDQPFSNFAVKDKRDLFQYSISPNNKLIGAYISREKEVVGIFMDKFLELFETGESLKEYFKKRYQRDVAKIEQIALILF